MEISEENYASQRCYNSDQCVIRNLNILYSKTNITVVLWNKFQIFIYDDLDFENIAKIVIPDFQIRRLLLCSNYLVSLDCTGNIHVISLKFKNTNQKRFKTCFQPKERAVIDFIQYDQDYILSVKQECGMYLLCLHKISTEYPLIKKITIIFKEHALVPNSIEDVILNIHHLSEDNKVNLKNVFPISEIVRNDHCFLVISYNNEIYGCICTFKDSEDEIKLTKLYSCPSGICSIEIDGTNLDITVSLKIGTILKLSLKDLSNKPLIEHLNTAVHKILALENSILYSDGLSMWKAENLFTKDIIFRKFFVTQVKDFVKVGDQVICTTFTNLIYTFHIDDNKSYLKIPTEEYTSADRVLNNMDCYNKIMAAVKENNDLIKKLNKDGDYITALSLNSRQDIMDNIIDIKAVVYDKYADVIVEDLEITLTEELINYFCNNTIFILITVNVALENKLSDILSDSLGDLKVHIVLSTEKEVLKTTSLRVCGTLKKTRILIPVTVKDFIEINVDVKIITDVPGVYEIRESTWAVLYRKQIKLKSEHFIKTTSDSNKIMNLKELQKPLEELLIEFSVKQFGNIFDFNRQTENDNFIDWTFYVKLPEDYKDLLKSKTSYDQFSNKKIQYLVEQMSAENFHKSKSNIILVIGNTKGKIEIEDDGFSNPLLKVTCRNSKVALNLRNFFANIILKNYVNKGPDKEFISSSFYTSVEYLQKEVKDCMMASSKTENLLPLIQQFERRIIGALPI